MAKICTVYARDCRGYQWKCKLGFHRISSDPKIIVKPRGFNADQNDLYQDKAFISNVLWAMHEKLARKQRTPMIALSNLEKTLQRGSVGFEINVSLESVDDDSFVINGSFESFLCHLGWVKDDLVEPLWILQKKIAQFSTSNPDADYSDVEDLQEDLRGRMRKACEKVGKKLEDLVCEHQAKKDGDLKP
jgi:hypothetical protein